MNLNISDETVFIRRLNEGDTEAFELVLPQYIDNTERMTNTSLSFILTGDYAKNREKSSF